MKRKNLQKNSISRFLRTRAGYLTLVATLGLGGIVGLDRTEVTSSPIAPVSQSIMGPIAQGVHDAETAVLAAVTAAPIESAVAGAAQVAWDLPNLDHHRVDYWIGRFQTDKRDDFATFLARKGRYAPMIREKLAERNMPQDLLYLAMIESGFNPKAYSSAKASGIWQFIAETGQRYGLDVNRAIDERNDPEKATDAALSYLSDLHERFGSWYLAAAAYNTGENRVGRIMREETGSERGDEESFYRIAHRLPRETRDYVPLMVAAARISKEPAKYGFDGIEPHEPLPAQKIVAKPATPLATIAKNSGTTVAEIKRLNPQLKLNRTRNDIASELRVPVGESESLAR